MSTEIGAGRQRVHAEVAFGGHDQDDPPARFDGADNGAAGEDGFVVGMGVQRHEHWSHSSVSFVSVSMVIAIKPARRRVA